MFNLSAPIELSFIFTTVGMVFAVIAVCIYLVKLKTINKEK